MRKSKLIMVFIILLSTLSCKKKKIHYEKSSNAIHINIENIEDKVIDTTILSNVNYIPLQTTKESIIGAIDKILHLNNFFILDKRLSKAVFIFSNEGKFITKIHNVGKGPGEYQHLTDFDIDSLGNVYIYDHQLGKLLKYNIKGKHLKTFNVIRNAEQMKVLDDSNIIFNQVTLDNNTYQLVSYNLLKNKESFILEARDILDTDQRIPDFTSQRLTKHKQNIYYTPPFSNTIYKVEPDKLTIAAEVTPNEYFMDKKTVQNILKNKENISDYPMIYQLKNYLEIKDYAYLNFKFGSFYDIFYSKKSKKYILMDNYNYKLGYPLSNIIGATEERYISKISSTFLHRMNLRNSDNLPRELRDKGLDSNPVLILYDLKIF